MSIRSWAESVAGNSVLLRRLSRWWRARTDAYPRWDQILDRPIWENAIQNARGGPKVLVATSVGAFLPGTTLESLLAVALTLRGADVHILLCDEALPACLESVIRWHPKGRNIERRGLTGNLCSDCFTPARRMLQDLGLTIHRYSDHLRPEDRRTAEELARTTPVSEISRYVQEGAKVGEHALAGALRFYARGTLEGEPEGEFVLRSYFRASILTAFATRRLLRAHRFESSMFNHGIYVPQGVIGEVARQERVRVVNWNPAYRKKCFIFSHGDTYHHTLMDEPVEAWQEMPWGPERERRTMEYLKSRWQGTNDWIWFHERPKEDLEAIARELGVDFSRPCIGLLTNVFWDAQLHYPANAFPNMLVWMTQTIEYFAKRPELQLLIRVHPAEIRGTIPSRQPIIDEIRKAIPALPPNVRMIPPESQVSTYAAMQSCDSVIIYGTKTGVELTSMGIPVVVAGEAWIRNKGLTLDARTAAEYFQLLDRLPLGKRLDEAQTLRARKYAYHFFFRRMIPVDGIEPAPGKALYRVAPGAFPSLLPGASRGVDVICRGILEGTPFIYDEPA